MFSVCSQLIGAHSHVMGSQVPGYSQLMWSRNSGCYRFLRVMFSGRYSYRAMAADQEREAEALEWCNTLIEDMADETR